MKKIEKLALAALWLWTLGFGVAGAQAPAKPQPTAAAAPADKLTLRDCLGILTALTQLDGRKVIVAAGKANESVELVPYSFGSSPSRSGLVRDAISHNLFMLAAVQQEAQAANRRIQNEVGKGATIAPGSKEAGDLDARLNEYLDRPCKVDLDQLRDEDLNLDKNEIPGTVLAALFKIRERK